MNQSKRIVFFDGECQLCSFFVRLILRLDKKNVIFFAPLQGETTKLYNVPFENNRKKNSVYYLNFLGFWDSSDAIIHILLDVGGLYRIFFVLFLIPKKIRDFLYKLIARNRFYFVRKTKTCSIPKNKFKDKFLP